MIENTQDRRSRDTPHPFHRCQSASGCRKYRGECRERSSKPGCQSSRITANRVLPAGLFCAPYSDAVSRIRSPNSSRHLVRAGDHVILAAFEDPDGRNPYPEVARDPWNPEPRWPALIAVVAVGGLYWALPAGLTIGPRWLFPAIIGVLLVLCSAKMTRTRVSRSRGLRQTIFMVQSSQNRRCDDSISFGNVMAD